MINEDPYISATAIAQQIGITPRGVEKQISKLREKGIVKRLGPAKGGYWSILVKEEQ